MRTPILIVGLACALATALSGVVPAVGAVTTLPDPATWTNARIAAQLTFGCVDAADTAGARAQARAGLGGTTLLGSDAPVDLAARLATVRAAAPTGYPDPFIASDEEGGGVQRLSRLIYPLPSAKTMGATWTTTRMHSTAVDYGTRMRRLGVTMDLAPDTDLAIPGYYIDSLGRGFSADPHRVSADVNAWVTGLLAARVAPVIKHWPGHGQATNSHVGAAVTPALSVLQARDMIPFQDEFARHAPVVMVGHLSVPGLTEGALPATESPRALSYLRAHAEPSTLIITDSLSMAAASTAIHRTIPQAAVAALRAGADVALTCSTAGVVTAIARAISTGVLPRTAALAKVRRLLAVKNRAGLALRYP